MIRKQKPSTIFRQSSIRALIFYKVLKYCEDFDDIDTVWYASFGIFQERDIGDYFHGMVEHDDLGQKFLVYLLLEDFSDWECEYEEFFHLLKDEEIKMKALGSRNILFFRTFPLDTFRSLPDKNHNVVEKVERAILYYKGKLFEKRCFQYLKELKIYDKVVWEGTSGKYEILAYKNNDIHIYPLKIIAINKKSQYLTLEDLRPEYKMALDSLHEGYNEIKLYLVVLVNFSNE